MATPEGRVKAAVKKILKDAEVFYFMPVSNGMGRVGIPDIICCINGYFIGVECKAPGKADNLTPNQRQVHAEIEKSKGVVLVVDNPIVFRKWLHDYLNLPLQLELPLE